MHGLGFNSWLFDLGSGLGLGSRLRLNLGFRLRLRLGSGRRGRLRLLLRLGLDLGFCFGLCRLHFNRLLLYSLFHLRCGLTGRLFGRFGLASGS